MKTLDNILYNRRQMFIIFIFFMIIVVIKVFCFPRYETAAMLMIDTKNRATSVDSDKVNLQDNLGPVRFNQELLVSDPILRKVVEDLKLYEDDDNFLFFKKKKFVASDLEKEILIRKEMQNLRKSVLTTTSPPFTTLIIVKARYPQAQKAADIVNHLISHFIEWNVEFNHQEVHNVLTYLNKEIEQAQQRLSKSEDDLKKFRDENQLMDSSEDVRLMYEFMKTTSEKELELEIKLMQQKELYTDESPQVKYLKEEVAELKQRLQGISLEDRFKNIPEKEMVLARLQRLVLIDEASFRFLTGEQEKAQLIKAKETTENIKVVFPAPVPLKPKGRINGLLIGGLISFILTMGLPLAWRHRKMLIG